jgi:uncharacterized membrane protein YcaP (DUF421 family)
MVPGAIDRIFTHAGPRGSRLSVWHSSMQPENIHLTDWHRLLFGEAPPTFLIEVLIRTLILFPLLLLMLRLMGKRMNGQLTITEMTVIITLGAIMGTAMQMPDRGLLQGAVALMLAVIFQRGLTLLEFRNPHVEHAVQGSASLLVKDGVMQLDAMRQARVNQEQLFAILREQRIDNLGRVERLYLEACGNFSVFCREEVHPGLSVLPPADPIHEDQPVVQFLRACRECGHTMVVPQDAACPNCHARKWESAVA